MPTPELLISPTGKSCTDVYLEVGEFLNHNFPDSELVAASVIVGLTILANGGMSHFMLANYLARVAYLIKKRGGRFEQRIIDGQPCLYIRVPEVN